MTNTVPATDDHTLPAGTVHWLTVGQEKIASLVDVAESIDRPCNVLWLHGLGSDMYGEKALRVAQFCCARGHRAIRMEYSGHGQSSGTLHQSSISGWLDQAQAVIQAHVPQGEKLIIGGHSLGGWLAILLAQRLSGTDQAGVELAGLLAVAPAFNLAGDYLLPVMTPSMRWELDTTGVCTLANDYDDDDPGYLISKSLLDDGLTYDIGPAGISLDCPLRILHGTADEVLPINAALLALERIASADAQANLIRDCDHRLSRPQDIALIIDAFEQLLALAK